MEIRKRIQELPHYRDVDYAVLDEQYGREFVDRRLREQWKLYHWRYHSRLRVLGRTYVTLYRLTVRVVLTLLGQWRKSKAEARSPVVVEREVVLPELPEVFDGIRILHLTDFHFDYNDELAGIVRKQLETIPFDLCVLTGDYRGETFGPFVDSMRELESVRSALGSEVYAVLGNHDCIEMAPHFKEMGIRLLVNEGVWLERDGSRILLAGIDDPHYFQTDDFSALAPLVEASAISLLLSHSPESYGEAEAVGFDTLWCGHTHGGQLCLPNGTALVTHLKNAQPGMEQGGWRWKGLQGYTSRGIGASGLDVRLNCPPEMTVHVLRRG